MATDGTTVTLANGLTRVIIDKATGTSTVSLIAAPGAGLALDLVRGTLQFFGTTAGEAQLVEETSSNELLGAVDIPASTITTIEITPDDQVRTTTANKALQVTRDQSFTVKGWLDYGTRGV